MDAACRRTVRKGSAFPASCLFIPKATPCGLSTYEITSELTIRRRSLGNNCNLPERQSLSALCGGKPHN